MIYNSVFSVSNSSKRRNILEFFRSFYNITHSTMPFVCNMQILEMCFLNQALAASFYWLGNFILIIEDYSLCKNQQESIDSFFYFWIFERHSCKVQVNLSLLRIKYDKKVDKSKIPCSVWMKWIHFTFINMNIKIKEHFSKMWTQIRQ